MKEVGRQQLRSWGILIERDGKDYPTNAYAILTGAGAFHTATQCGVFKGSTKEVFVDRREYDGPIWEQIEQAFQYVLRNILWERILSEYIDKMFMKFRQMLFVS